MQENRQDYLSLEKNQHDNLGLAQSLRTLETTPNLQAFEQEADCPSQIYQKAFFQQNIKTSKQNIAWTQQEDQYLLEKAQSKIHKGQKVSWKSLAIQLNNQFHDGSNARDRLKTRQRFYNCLDPNLKKGNWTEAEDLFIVLKKSQGQQWCKIKSYIQGRNDHQVKNRFYFLLKQFSKNNPYCVKIFTSQLKVNDFSQYITTYLQNEKNDKLKQIMKSLAKRKNLNKQENAEVQIQIDYIQPMDSQPQQSAFVAYNSDYKKQLAIRQMERLQQINQVNLTQQLPSLMGFNQFALASSNTTNYQNQISNNQRQYLICSYQDVKWNVNL